MGTAYLALGANIGNREANIRMALLGLTRMGRVESVSSLYESEPEGPPQPKYYNAVCRIETGLEPAALLRYLKSLEHEIGRRPTAERSRPRPIDIDILLYDERAAKNPDLEIPHPRMQNRAFVMIPLAEIAPETEVLGHRAADIANTLNESGLSVVRQSGWDGVVATEQDVRL